MTVSGPGDTPPSGPDFFISYTQADTAWAEWAAWELEAAGYSVVIQAWDFVPATNFVVEMSRAMETSQRTVAILSELYLRSEWATAEWQAAVDRDRLGDKRKLVVLRVEDCSPPVLLRTRVYVDLFGVSKEVAKSRLLAAASGERVKPSRPPGFPGGYRPSGLPLAEPDFPAERRPSVFRTAGRLLRTFYVLVVIGIVATGVWVATPKILNEIRGGPGPVVQQAVGSPPWLIEGQGYRYEIDSATRSTVVASFGEPRTATVVIRGFVTRTGSTSFSSTSIQVRNQDGVILDGATTNGADAVSRWEEFPVRDQRLPFEVVVYEAKAATTSVTITITDFYVRNGGLILQNVPVPSA